MTINIKIDTDGTIRSIDDDVSLIIWMPNTSTTSGVMTIESPKKLIEAFKLFEKYEVKSLVLTSYLPETHLCFENLHYFNEVKKLDVDFLNKRASN